MPTLSCPYCYYHNDISAETCQQCHKKLAFSESEIGLKQLRNELAAFKQKVELRYDELQDKLEEAERKLVFLKNKETTKTEKVVEQVKKAEIEKPLKTVEKVISAEKKEPLKEFLKEKTKEQVYATAKKQEENFDYAWKKIQKFLTKTLLLGTFLAPITPFFTYFIDLYLHFKKQDRLPVFFMTIGGIIALLFGFGYLMQFVDGYVFELIKISGTVLFNASLIVLGMYFHRQEKKYHNFGSSLLGLSISLNFLLIYFLSYSQFFTVFTNNPWLNTSLILCNSILAFYLALRYDTRVVLIVSLFGGAFAPFYLGTNIISWYYFAYLWILCGITVLIALKIRWETAGTLAFVVSSVVLGMVIYTPRYFQNTPLAVLTIALMAFAYLFFFFTVSEQKVASSGFQFRLKETMVATDIFSLAANTTFLIANLFYVHDNGTASFQRPLGYLYLLNAAIFGAGYLIFIKATSPKIKVLWLTLIATFVAFSIPQLFNENLSGLFWSVEGLVLVFCGFLFALENVRREGYVVLCFGIVKILFLFPNVLSNWQRILWTDAYKNFISLGLILVLCKLLIDKIKPKAGSYEDIIRYVAMELLTVWVLVVFWIPIQFYLPVVSYNLMLIFVYACLVWSYKHRLPIGEAVAFASLGFLAYGYYLSTVETDSVIFRFQTRFAQTAAVELFLSLWVFQLMYEKVLPKISRVEPHVFYENTETETQEPVNLPLQISKLFREVFYLTLPLLLLPTVFRFYPEYSNIAISASILIAFVVAEITKRVAVKVELHFLALASAWMLWNDATSLSLANPSPIFAFSLIASVVAFLSILIYSKGFLVYTGDKKDDLGAFKAYRLFHSYTPYHFVFLAGLATVFLFERSELMGCFVMTIFISVLVLFRNSIVPIQSTYKFAYRIAVLAALGMIVFMYANIELNLRYSVGYAELVALLVLTLIFYIATYTDHYPMQKTGEVWSFDLFCLHLLTLGIYSTLVEIFSNNTHSIWMTILLTIHACILLFHSTTKLYKFSLKISIGLFLIALLKLYFIDMENSSLKQKIITFMVIGVMMLVFPYLFMKYKEKNKTE